MLLKLLLSLLSFLYPRVESLQLIMELAILRDDFNFLAVQDSSIGDTDHNDYRDSDLDLNYDIEE